MHSQMGAASFACSVGVLLVTIGKTSTTLTGAAKSDAEVRGLGGLLSLDVMLLNMQ